MPDTQKNTPDEEKQLEREIKERVLRLPAKRKDRFLLWVIAPMSKEMLERLEMYLDIEEHCSKSD